MRIVSSKQEISKLDPAEELVHLTFRPSNADVVSLIAACPNLTAVHIPNSYKNTMSKSARMFMSENNITILAGDVWGHRKDLNHHYTVSEAVTLEILDHQKAGRSREEIIRRIKRNSRLSPDLINYIIDQNSERLDI